MTNIQEMYYVSSLIILVAVGSWLFLSCIDSIFVINAKKWKQMLIIFLFGPIIYIVVICYMVDIFIKNRLKKWIVK